MSDTDLPFSPEAIDQAFASLREAFNALQPNQQVPFLVGLTEHTEAVAQASTFLGALNLLHCTRVMNAKSAGKPEPDGGVAMMATGGVIAADGRPHAPCMVITYAHTWPDSALDDLRRQVRVHNAKRAIQGESKSE